VALLTDLNPRLDAWQRQWTWSGEYKDYFASFPRLLLSPSIGSYDAITVDTYINLVKIYGEHTRLCLNSLSLHLIMADEEFDTAQNHVAASCLAKACEAAVALIQCYVGSSHEEPVVRYGGEVSTNRSPSVTTC
jgi:hypothetical protein